MAGKLWLWCGEAAVPDPAPLLGLERWRSGMGRLSCHDAVLVWGADSWPGEQAACGSGAEGDEVACADGGKPWVLNAGAAAVAAMSGDGLAQRLELSGISSRAEEPGRLLRIAVFHMETLFVERVRGLGWAAHGELRLDKSRSQRIGQNGIKAAFSGRAEELAAISKSEDADWRTAPAEPEDADMKRACRFAKRIVYELQLDAAEVFVRLGDSGRLYAEAVRLPGCLSLLPTGSEGAPPEAKELAVLSPSFWSPAVRRLQLLVKSEALRQSGESPTVLRIGADPEFLIVRANGRVFSAAGLGGLHSPVGSDMLIRGRNLRQPVGELRPEPATSEEELLRSLRRLLALAARRGIREPGMRLAAGAMPVPGIALGGHVHLSGIALTSRLLHVMDSYAAIPLALAEDPSGKNRRPRYGTFGDSRHQPHGGFEYRTLPSWLVSPAAARYALAISMLIAEDFAWLDDLPSVEETYIRAYYQGNRHVLAGCLPRLRAALEKAPSYDKRRPMLEPLLDAVEAGAVWDESLDIRIKWGIQSVVQSNS
ncbi:hypothetical protein M3223_16620 [Paenibacillus pasadenensis]|uniref:putative amidoligase domain-containing protein n=1 Tax=Paenibacillus pasadenensis TaxID=217090 RepID=UPI00203AF549|nr:hypothetical protein [Paenibacillus pasadenensis]MCM3748981.1 hypothetical protein [Paenibacillus pasadenensis]